MFCRCRVPVLFVLLTLLPVRSQAERLVSPPLPSLGDKRLVLRLPRGWGVVRKDPQEMWYRRSYEFAISPSDAAARRRLAVVAAAGVVTIEVWSNDTGMARARGDLRGRYFVTPHGLRAVVHPETRGRNDTDWYMAIPDHATDDTTVIRVIALSGHLTQQRALTDRIWEALKVL